LTFNPSYEKALYNLAVTYYQIGDLDQSEKYVKLTSKSEEPKAKLLKAIQEARAKNSQ